MGIKKVQGSLFPYSVIAAGLLIIAALVPAPPAGAIEAPPPIVDTMVVTCTIQPVIEARFPKFVNMENLSPGVPYESLPLDISVRSNCAWVVKIKSDLADGRLREWNGSEYVNPGAALTQPLLWRVEGGSGDFAPLTSTEAVVAQGSGPTGDSPVMTNINLTQTLSFADKALPAGSCYRGVITFIAAAVY